MHAIETAFTMTLRLTFFSSTTPSLSFFSYSSVDHRDLHSFPTRRSSDLSIKLIQASAVLDLTEDDFDFLTSNKVWIATDRSRARRCVEACVYGTLDFVGYPRFPAPVEFIAAVIAYYVHPVNI